MEPKLAVVPTRVGVNHKYTCGGNEIGYCPHARGGELPENSWTSVASPAGSSSPTFPRTSANGGTHREKVPQRPSAAPSPRTGIMTCMEGGTHDQSFVITFGFGKEHRPDFKQLVHSLLCVDEGIPIYYKCENGNLSDKVVNRTLIPKMVERIAELGQENFL